MLVDTSGMLAMVNVRDGHHQDVVACLRERPERLIVPLTVLPEVDYMLTHRAGPHVAISTLSAIVAEKFQFESVTADDLPRTLELMRQYADANIGLVDASLVAVAERLGVRRILTLDRRHFGPIRPRHCSAFEILP